MIWWHRVGQKVVGRNIKETGDHIKERGPKNGEVLTIREVKTYPSGAVAFRFVEIRNEPKQWANSFGESTFVSSAFEPVCPQRVEDLRALLNPTPEQKRPFLVELIEERVANAGFR